MASCGAARVEKDSNILVPIRGPFLKGLNIDLESLETCIPEVDILLKAARTHSKLPWAHVRGPYLQPRLFLGMGLQLPNTTPSRKQDSTDTLGIKSLKNS